MKTKNAEIEITVTMQNTCSQKYMTLMMEVLAIIDKYQNDLKLERIVIQESEERTLC